MISTAWDRLLTFFPFTPTCDRKILRYLTPTFATPHIPQLLRVQVSPISSMNADLGIPLLIVSINEDIRSVGAVHCSLDNISLGLDGLQRVDEGLQETCVA